MSSQNFIIEPPPKESGNDFYRVVYVIDIVASSPKEAARLVDVIMKDEQSIPPVLHIIDGDGKNVEIDLSKEN